MKILVRSLIVVGLAVTFACAETTVPYPRLDQPDAIESEYRDAAKIVAAAISKEGLLPHEYIVEIHPDVEHGIIRFSLWHESAMGDFQNVHVRGDLSKKCRTAIYSVMTKKVVEIQRWR